MQPARPWDLMRLAVHLHGVEHPLVVLGALGFHDRLSLTCLASPEPATAFS